MSFENVVHHSFSAVTGADLSANQYFGVKLNSSGKAVLAAAGQFAVGVLQNNPGNGQVASIATVGAITKAKAGGTIAAGATVAVNSAGKFVDATEAVVATNDAGSSTDAVIGSNVIGVALAAAVDGDIFPLLLTMSGATPTTAA